MTTTNVALVGGPYPGDGDKTNFSFGFYIADAAELQVNQHLIDTDVRSVLDVGADYTLDAGSVGTDDGGSITWVGDAPSSNVQITLLRVIPAEQNTDLKNVGKWSGAVVESQMDIFARQFISIQEQIDRCIKLPPNEQAFNCEAPTAQADEFLTVNPGRTAFTWSSSSAASVTLGDLDTTGAVNNDVMQFNSTSLAWEGHQNVTIGGTLSAVGAATFTGLITADTATLTGLLTAPSPTFTGTIDAAAATFSGDVEMKAASGDITHTIDADAGTDATAWLYMKSGGEIAFFDLKESASRFRMSTNTAGAYIQFATDTNDTHLKLSGQTGSQLAEFEGDVDVGGDLQVDGVVQIGSVTPDQDGVNGQANELVISTNSHCGATFATTSTGATTNLNFAEGDDDRLARISMNGTNHGTPVQFTIGTHVTDGYMLLQTAVGTTALTLDASQNATFKGDVTVKGGEINLEKDSSTIHFENTGGTSTGNLNIILSSNKALYLQNGQNVTSSPTGNTTAHIILQTFSGGTHTFTFGADGDTSLPGDLDVTGDVTVLGGDINIPVDNGRLFLQRTSGSGSAQLKFNNSSDLLLTNITNAGGCDVYIQVRNGTYSWQFDSSGHLTTPGDVNVTGNVDVTGDVIVGGFLNYGSIGSTIYTGPPTGNYPQMASLAVTQTRHRVDTYNGADSIIVKEITGGSDGDILIIRTVHDDRHLVFNNNGNICVFSSSTTLWESTDSVTFIYDGDLEKWLEISYTTTTPGSGGF